MLRRWLGARSCLCLGTGGNNSCTGIHTINFSLRGKGTLDVSRFGQLCLEALKESNVLINESHHLSALHQVTAGSVSLILLLQVFEPRVRRHQGLTGNSLVGRESLHLILDSDEGLKIACSLNSCLEFLELELILGGPVGGAANSASFDFLELNVVALA